MKILRLIDRSVEDILTPHIGRYGFTEDALEKIYSLIDEFYEDEEPVEEWMIIDELNFFQEIIEDNVGDIGDEEEIYPLANGNVLIYKG